MLLSAAPPGVHAATVTKATIEAGKLVIEGTTKKPKAKVKIDKTFKTRSNRKKLFSFSLAYHPDDCVVSLLEAGEADDVVIGNCGETGKRGRRGKRGFQGDAGEPGPQGLTGEKGDNGDKGDTGAKGDTGSQGLRGDKGDKGDPGEDGAGAGKWWYQEETVSSSTSAILKFENGGQFYRARGFVACTTINMVDENNVTSYWSVFHSDSGLIGGTQYAEELLLSGAASIGKPILFVEDNIIKFKINSVFDLNVRCRIERLD